jgi:hypothetical protein
MSLPGHVENGVVIFDSGATLPEGTKVVIAPIAGDQDGAQRELGGWEAAFEAARDLEHYDYDAWRKQRDHDESRARDHLP